MNMFLILVFLVLVKALLYRMWKINLVMYAHHLIIGLLYLYLLSPKFMKCLYLISVLITFGFTKGLCCAKAIFTLRTTIDYFNGCGSSIYAVSLDIYKAFDTVNHYKLMCSLTKVGFPKYLVAMLNIWYSNLEIVVRWNMSLSNTLSVRSGVRQGIILSPS